ncbi:hypothetical protein K523DRAFT_323613 [Schizophyllum commune Tattone D]|nr:hypothetical protein K523DRAFT_323613 [Schizophyllum commune Tattone D]
MQCVELARYWSEASRLARCGGLCCDLPAGRLIFGTSFGLRAVINHINLVVLDVL